MKARETGVHKLSNEESAFIKELVLRNDTLIRNVLKGVFANRYQQLTDECIGATYLLACERIETLKDHPNPDGWIVKAAKTKALELLRNREKTVSFDITELLDREGNVEEDAQYNIWMERFYISEVLGKLTKREKQIYKILYIHRVPVDMAAKMLGISEKTLLNVRRKIILKVKKQLFE